MTTTDYLSAPNSRYRLDNANEHTFRSSLPDDETTSTNTADLAVTPEPSSRLQCRERSDLLTGRVYINTEQYFDSVPEVALNFYLCGYQPAQKWLKEDKGRVLDFEDIMHYQKIIKALTKTDRVIGEIDGVGVDLTKMPVIV